LRETITAADRHLWRYDVREGLLRLLYCVLGVALLVVAGVIDARREHRIAAGRQTTGIIIRFDPASGPEGDGMYRTVAQFTADDGTTQLVQSKVLSNFAPRLGTTVPVNYPAGHPEQARIFDWLGRWYDIGIIAGFGAMMVLIGVFGRSTDTASDFYSASW
jgi:hypothetical protein